MVCFEADPFHRGRRRRTAQRLALGLDASHAQLDHPVEARRRQLLAGLGPVAAIGDEHTTAPGDQQHARRAAEPGEVADVGERSHEERVDPGVVDPGAQARHPVADLRRRKRIVVTGERALAAHHGVPDGRGASKAATALIAKG